MYSHNEHVLTSLPKLFRNVSVFLADFIDLKLQRLYNTFSNYCNSL